MQIYFWSQNISVRCKPNVYHVCGWSYLGYFFLFWNEFRSFFLVWHCWNQLFPTREGIWCWSRKSISTYGFINQIQPKSCLQKQPTWIQSSIPTKLNKKVFFGLIKNHGKRLRYKHFQNFLSYFDTSKKLFNNFQKKIFQLYSTHRYLLCERAG